MNKTPALVRHPCQVWSRWSTNVRWSRDTSLPNWGGAVDLPRIHFLIRVDLRPNNPFPPPSSNAKGGCAAIDRRRSSFSVAVDLCDWPWRHDQVAVRWIHLHLPSLPRWREGEELSSSMSFALFLFYFTIECQKTFRMWHIN